MFTLLNFWSFVKRRTLQGFLLLYLVIAVPVRALYWQIKLIGKPQSPRDKNDPYFDVICFSHVPWSHIWQRNHHTMTRLGRNRKVVYMQTATIAYIHWFVRHWPHSQQEFNSQFPGVKLVYPLLFPGQSRLPLIGWLNRWLLTTEMRWLEHTMGLRNTVLWFYYPATINVLEKFNPSAVIYDIQDEYTAFDWSPPDIADREKTLIDRADIIFAGTHALYDTKTVGFKGAAYFYPCAVEFSHFYQAAPRFTDDFFDQHPEISAEARAKIQHVDSLFRSSGEEYGTVARPTSSSGSQAQQVTIGRKFTPARVSEKYLKRASGSGVALREPEELRPYGRPRLIYVGLIDKRIDPDLLAHMGQAHPEWEIIMVGPVDPRFFDQQSVEMAAPNARFLGSQQYYDLPQFLAHCDVYLMPWIVNELTLHINPTKTLEYMAAARPVVSISLPDLENLFSDSVNLATNYDDFVRECEAALAGQRWDKVARGLERAWEFAWNTVVNEMESHVSRAITGKGQSDS